ncbi:MucBP domain-containing protein [Listeria costaricensis]|uniref:MucBP domain-containing protein n=1 Tax=Listeria costaricensis TaxID=2026604 RepID=UPI000C0868B9|nr:MucBP domain-containing protein [Listeria costaricensis]
MWKKISFVVILCMLITILLPVSQTAYAADSWLYDTMDENQSFVDDIVSSYNREHGTSLTEQDFNQDKLNQLHQLYISSNYSLPDKFDLMPNLTEVYAAATGISTIPNSIGSLQHLETLNWNQNGLTEFPMVVLNLPQLKVLEINGGTIDSIPPEISQLLDTLETLDIRFNQLVTLPDELFEGQSDLYLVMTDNQIVSDVPSSYMDSYNEGNNLLEHAEAGHQTQDQLVYNGDTLTVSVGTDFSKLVPDKSDLGLESGRELFAGHEFEYYDDGQDPHIKNGIATSPGKAEIYIKSSFSTTTNSYAKVKIPVQIEEATEGQVTVNYLDENGEPLADSEVLTGTVGTDYTTTPKEIDGYELIGTPDNATGQYTTSPITVNYNYQKVAPSVQNGQVTVQYLDENGQALAPTDTLTGEVGTPYTTVAKTIDGYKLKEEPENAAGNYTADPQTVTYIYEQDAVPALTGTVTVKYQDEDGNQLLPDSMLTGAVGTPYQTAAQEIDGYTLMKQPENADGVFSQTNQNVIYLYQKNDDITVSPNGDTSSMVQTAGSMPSQGLPAQETLTLPKTGDENDARGLLGLALASGASMLLWTTRKRK